MLKLALHGVERIAEETAPGGRGAAGFLAVLVVTLAATPPPWGTKSQVVSGG